MRHAQLEYDVKARQRRAKGDSNFALTNHAASLHLQLTSYETQLLVDTCIMPLLAFRDFLNLKSLHVDFLDFRKAFSMGKRYAKDWDDRAPWMMVLAKNTERITARHKNPRKF